MKICRTCAKPKPATAFYTTRNAAGEVVLRASCKQCQAAREIQRKKELVHEPQPATKVCNRCRRKRPSTAFYRLAATVDGLTRECKKCLNARRAAHKKANLARERSRQAAYAKTPKQREKRREWYRQNIENSRASTRKRYRANHDRARAKRDVRRARKRAVPHETISRHKVFDRDKGICHICKKPVALQKMHLDHLIPLSRGGPHTYANVRVAHAVCNLRKSNKLVA
jgi:5-methylcytosine-specific restriction endonuclease McrA